MSDLTDADIAEGLRLDAALKRFQGQWGTGDYADVRDDFRAHAANHYADALREVRRLREELAATQKQARYRMETVQSIDVLERGCVKTADGNAYVREQVRMAVDNCLWFAEEGNAEGWLVVSQVAWDDSLALSARLAAALEPFARPPATGPEGCDCHHCHARRALSDARAAGLGEESNRA